MKPANRINEIQEYYFSRKLKEVAQLNAQGLDIISLAIGSPDMPPSQQTIEKLCEVAKQSDAHGYQPTMGTPELRESMANFYKKWYGVDINPATEIQPLIGSKEGILHTTLAFVNPGEEVLVPNPGYPTYTSLSKIHLLSLIICVIPCFTISVYRNFDVGPATLAYTLFFVIINIAGSIFILK